MDSSQTAKTANLVQRKTVSPADIRILLWDIDGTLMTSTKGGAYKQYFGPVLEEIYGTSGKLADMSVSGMTDPQIAYEAIRDEGFSVEDIFERLAEFSAALEIGMRKFIERRENPYRIFAGAREILNETVRIPRFNNALLSGNLSVAAKIKLEFVDLWHYFEDAPHAFGEISHDRRRLAHEAGRIYREHLCVELKPEQFVIIGDTPNDIACARDFGAKVISIATGRNHPPEELAQYDPDFLLENLEDTTLLLEIINGL